MRSKPERAGFAVKSIPCGIGEMFDVVKREIFRCAPCEMFSLRSNVKSSFGSQCTLTLVGGDVLDAPKIAKFSRYIK